jgi:hypothetical protein
MITKEELAALAGVEARPVVSIYIPTHERGREVRQDPIRMRNAIGAATGRLVAAGMRQADADELLALAHALAADEIFWRHQARGLAVFAAPGGFFQAHKLPVEVAEALHVGPRPHVKPLLPLLADDGRFYVLTAQVADARLYLGTRHGLSEMDVDIPRSVAEVTAETEYEGTQHAAPPARPRAAAPVGMPATHGFGESPEEQRKAQLVEHLRRLHNALERELAGDSTPIVVVAQPEMQGHLRALAKNVRFLEERVQKDPSAMREQEIHESAYEIVRPLFARDREHALDRFRALAGSGDARASSDLRAVVSGARFQRVDTLFLAEGAEVWGRHDAERDRIELEREATPESEDLLDYAAVHALTNGAPVWVVPREQMPADAPACATFRF